MCAANRISKLIEDLRFVKRLMDYLPENRPFMDSMGTPIEVGDVVKFRGRFYHIKNFRRGEGKMNTAAIDFVEPCHTNEIADEISVDLFQRNKRKKEFQK